MIAGAEFDVVQAGMEITQQKPLPTFIAATPTGLQLAKDLTFEEWTAIGSSFGTALQTAAWCIGDWLVYGEVNFGRVKSEAYDAALISTGLDRSTLKSYASVCRSIPRDERNPALTFGHHRDLATLPAAARGEWFKVATSQPSPPSVKRLRMSLRLAGDGPARIATDDEITSRGEQAGHDNYIPHLTRLLTILRKTIPGMSQDQRTALKEDTEQLVDMLRDL